MIKIQSGSLKGRTISKLEHLDLRPTTAFNRTFIINKLINSNKILDDGIAGKTVMDAFCGTGSMGLELLSNGGGYLYCCDSNATSIKLVEKFCSITNLNNVETKLMDWHSPKLSDISKKIDILFLDPPYQHSEKLIKLAIDQVIKFDLLASNAIIITETPKEQGINLVSILNQCHLIEQNSTRKDRVINFFTLKASV